MLVAFFERVNIIKAAWHNIKVTWRLAWWFAKLLY